MPIVFIAMLDGIGRIRRSSPGWLRRYADHVPTAALAIALVLIMQFPLHNLFQAQTYHPNRAAAAASGAAIALMPRGASVETNMGLVTHLVTDYHVYWYASVGSVAPDYVLIDTHTSHDGVGTDVADYAQRQHPGHRYVQIYRTDGYLLARRAD